jgi:hypothetical protein
LKTRKGVSMAASDPGAFVIKHCQFGFNLTLNEIADRKNGLAWMAKMAAWKQCFPQTRAALLAYLGQPDVVDGVKAAVAKHKKALRARARVGPFRTWAEKCRAEEYGIK